MDLARELDKQISHLMEARLDGLHTSPIHADVSPSDSIRIWRVADFFDPVVVTTVQIASEYLRDSIRFKGHKMTFMGHDLLLIDSLDVLFKILLKPNDLFGERTIPIRGPE